MRKSRAEHKCDRAGLLLRVQLSGALLLSLILVSQSSACPMCKDSTVNIPAAGTQPAAINFNRSIYVMLGGLAAVAGFTGRILYRAVKESH